MHVKGILVSAVVAYAVIVLTARVSFLKTMAGFQPGS